MPDAQWDPGYDDPTYHLPPPDDAVDPDWWRPNGPGQTAVLVVGVGIALAITVAVETAEALALLWARRPHPRTNPRSTP